MIARSAQQRLMDRRNGQWMGDLDHQYCSAMSNGLMGDGMDDGHAFLT